MSANRFHCTSVANAVVVLLLMVSISGAASGETRTPQLSISFKLGADGRQWKQDFLAGNSEKIISEWVPEGQSVEAWDEMVAQQINFTGVSLQNFVSDWKRTTARSAGDLELKESVGKDGSVTIIYRSRLFREVGIRRFMKGQDGIYALAYHARPQTLKKDAFQHWSKIIADARLVPNPMRRSK